MFCRFCVLAVGLAGLIGVDLSLLVHRQQPVIVHADAGEPGVPAGVKDRGCGLSAGPGVDVLVGSQCGLPSAAGCGLQVMETVGSLGRGGNLCWPVVLRPGVDAAVTGQAHNLLPCGMNTGKLRFLPVGRADGQQSARSGPVVRAQRPVCCFAPLRSQGSVLEDGGLEVERLVVKCPPVEPEAITYRVVFRR